MFGIGLWCLGSATPSAVAPSGGSRYAAVVQRNQDLVQFIDGGLWQEDHQGHVHDYQDAPRLMPFQLTQARPTHFQQAPGQLAVFFDGNAATATAARVAMLADADITKARSDYPQMTLNTHQHGAAQARGEYLVITIRNANSNSTLPDKVGVYHLHEDHFDLEDIFEVTCPELHGSAQNHDFVAFGCLNGVMLIRQSGTTFTASKLANTAAFTGAMRIGSLAGYDTAEHFIGLAGTAVFAIDPANGGMERLNWQPGNATAIWGFDFAEQGKKFVLLDHASA